MQILFHAINSKYLFIDKNKKNLMRTLQLGSKPEKIYLSHFRFLELLWHQIVRFEKS